MRSYMGSRSQEQASRSSKYTIWNRILWIETLETMHDIYSNNYRLKVYTGNCIIQLNVNPKDPSESFFDVYDRDEMKLIYGIKISILKEMFII